MRWITSLFVLAATIGCGREVVPPLPQSGAAPVATASEPAQRKSTESQLAVVILGDSLTAGLGVESEEAFPTLVEQRLQQDGWPVRVINAGVSGDTTAGGLARIDWLMAQKPFLLVVALGANDGLRGLPVEEMADNLRAIVRTSQEAGSRVLLLGMKVPPNYGDDYATRFEAVYPDLAAEFGVPLMPFLLESVGGRADLNQADGIHPNATGHRAIAVDVVPYLETELRQAQRQVGQEEAA